MQKWFEQNNIFSGNKHEMFVLITTNMFQALHDLLEGSNDIRSVITLDQKESTLV